MPAQQIDAILLHELAHVRRRDYLVTCCRLSVEGFLFYHPRCGGSRALSAPNAKTVVTTWWWP